MVAGMAATRPIAVANRASAMPGATTANEVFFEAAIDWKLVIMPQTVPNRPMNGPADPAGRPLERALPLPHRRDEQGRHRMRRPRRLRAIKLFQRLAGPERLLET